MVPVTDDATGFAVRSFNDTVMGADNGPLNHDHQPFGIDVQANKAVCEACGHRATIAIKGNQAGFRAILQASYASQIMAQF